MKHLICYLMLIYSLFITPAHGAVCDHPVRDITKTDPISLSALTTNARVVARVHLHINFETDAPRSLGCMNRAHCRSVLLPDQLQTCLLNRSLTNRTQISLFGRIRC